MSLCESLSEWYFEQSPTFWSTSEAINFKIVFNTAYPRGGRGSLMHWIWLKRETRVNTSNTKKYMKRTVLNRYKYKCNSSQIVALKLKIWPNFAHFFTAFFTFTITVFLAIKVLLDWEIFCKCVIMYILMILTMFVHTYVLFNHVALCLYTSLEVAIVNFWVYYIICFINTWKLF